MPFRLLIAIVFVALSFPAFSYSPTYNSGYDPVSVAEPLLLSKKWDELSDKEKKRIKDAKEKYRKLPADEQQKLRKKWEKMSPKEREKYKLEKKYR